MKALFIFIHILLTIDAYSQSERFFVRSVSSNCISSINLNVAGNVKIFTWEEEYIRIITRVNVSDIKKETYDRIIKSGRYSIINHTVDSARIISLNVDINHSKLIVDGREIKESVSFEIFIPQSVRDVKHNNHPLDLDYKNGIVF